MKTKFLILLLLLVLSSYPSRSIYAQTESNPPAPEFITITPVSENADSIYENGTIVTIQYRADRFEVQGLLLAGEGSGLKLDPTQSRNFTKVSSLGPSSIYEIELEISNYTYFYAYSWSNSLSNNTKEVLNRNDAAPGHQLWTTVGSQFPVFVDVLGGTPTIENIEREDSEEFYAPMGSNLTIVYETQDPINATTVTVSFANSTENLYNNTLSQRFPMNQTEYSVGDPGISRFEFNYTVTQRIVFFTAFNNYGWEQIRDNQPISHFITTGFDFNVTFTEEINQYTNLDPIVFNVSTYNATSDDSFSYRYRYFENDSSDDPLSDWQEVSLTNVLITNELVNSTRNGVNYTDTKTVYNANINVNFNASNILELQIYVDYFGSSYNESDPYQILIHDSRPELTILTKDDIVTNRDSAVIDWEYSTLRGTIFNATISSDKTTLSTSILGLDNFTVNFVEGENAIEGNHTITITVFNIFEVVNITDPLQSRYTVFASQTATAIYRVDQTNPSIVYSVMNSTKIKGKVIIDFTFEDLGISPSGVAYATIDWGNGLIIDATDLTKASTVYRYSGLYTITINVTDHAGNFNVTAFSINVIAQQITTSKKRDSPISMVNVLAAFILMATIMKSLRRRTIK